MLASFQKIIPLRKIFYFLQIQSIFRLTLRRNLLISNKLISNLIFLISKLVHRFRLADLKEKNCLLEIFIFLKFLLLAIRFILLISIRC